MKKVIYNVLKANLISSCKFPYDIEVIAENFIVPWAIDESCEGKLYITERYGAIRILENGVVRSQPLITFQAPFVSVGEGGLMGIVLDPNFSQNRYIYVMHSFIDGNQIYNRVVRLVEQDNSS